MRILHVTREHGSDRRYGIGRSLAPVLAALEARGHAVRYLTQEDQTARSRAAQQRWTQRFARLGERCFGPAGGVLAAVWLERLNMGRLAARVARQMQADVVHLHDPWMAWGFRLARGGPVRWGVSEHGFGAYTDAVGEEGVPYRPGLLRWHRRQEARVLAAAGFVICPTQSARAQLARDLALPAPGAHWQAVPHARPVLPLPTRAAARQALGWATESTQLLAIGRINPVKRFDALVRACVQMNRPLHLTLLGEGDAAPLHALAAQGAQLRLTVAAVDDVAPYLAAADLYISSSRNESFGIANLEALAAGLPAVCTAVGSVPEVVGAGALLVSGADADLSAGLAQAIAGLLDDPGRRQRLSDVGRQRAQAWPDADAVAARLEAIYRGPGEALHGGA